MRFTAKKSKIRWTDLNKQQIIYCIISRYEWEKVIQIFKGFFFYPGSPLISTKADDLTTHEGMDLNLFFFKSHKNHLAEALSQFTYFLLQKD